MSWSFSLTELVEVGAGVCSAIVREKVLPTVVRKQRSDREDPLGFRVSTCPEMRVEIGSRLGVARCRKNFCSASILKIQSVTGVYGLGFWSSVFGVRHVIMNLGLLQVVSPHFPEDRDESWAGVGKSLLCSTREKSNVQKSIKQTQRRRRLGNFLAQCWPALCKEGAGISWIWWTL